MLFVVDGFGDFRSGLLAAKERDLAPLAEESAETLHLDAEAAAQMELFLDKAWFGGTYSGHEKLCRWAEQEGRGPVEIDKEALEARFKALMEASAETLNLSLPGTVTLWRYLTKAWVAGVRSSEAQLAALLLPRHADVAEEALRWLREREE